MGLFDELFGSVDDKSKKRRDWDTSVFDDDRFKSRDSGNWVDWEDVSTSDVTTDGFEHPSMDDDGEW